ncbi:hypothetical protein AK812_SmicGene11045 [Symbiodinium microadriaticum]|uniref:Uncharacterized protein n=1 Tax=Symbiodinium microadriaticum TaxID=2951 RepID=A0A1Q9EEC8_SYMMI|nr:hypothetical protein AK812_SmicGene11045 [Symbiodinium microadriaticum]
MGDDDNDDKNLVILMVDFATMMVIFLLKEASPLRGRLQAAVERGVRYSGDGGILCIMVVSALVSQALQAWIVEADSSVEEDSTKVVKHVIEALSAVSFATSSAVVMLVSWLALGVLSMNHSGGPGADGNQNSTDFAPAVQSWNAMQVDLDRQYLVTFIDSSAGFAVKDVKLTQDRGPYLKVHGMMYNEKDQLTVCDFLVPKEQRSIRTLAGPDDHPMDDVPPCVDFEMEMPPSNPTWQDHLGDMLEIIAQVMMILGEAADDIASRATPWQKCRETQLQRSRELATGATAPQVDPCVHDASSRQTQVMSMRGGVLGSSRRSDVRLSQIHNFAMGSGASLAAGDGEIKKIAKCKEAPKSDQFCVAKSNICTLLFGNTLLIYDTTAKSQSALSVMKNSCCLCVSDDKVYILGPRGLQVLDPATKKLQILHEGNLISSEHFHSYLNMIPIKRCLYLLYRLIDEDHWKLLRYKVDLGQIKEVNTPFQENSDMLWNILPHGNCMCAAAGTLFAFTRDAVYRLDDGNSMVEFAKLPAQVQASRAFTSTCVVNGVIYAAPAQATEMLSLDISNGKTELISVGDGVHSSGRHANFSSICTADGKLYLAPAYATRMVVYDIKKRTIREVDVSSAGIGAGKPKFRAICPAGGKIYLAPDHAEKMFVYDPTINAGMGVELPESCSGTKYGDMCALGGKVYLAPHGTCSVLECTDHHAFSKTSSAKAILAEYEAEKAKFEQLWAERIRPAKEALKKESERAGISLNFVIDGFPKLSKVKAFPADDPRTPKTFRNLKPSLFAEGSGYGFDLICPRDRQKGCSLVDAMYERDEANRGMATHFVSWCWGYTVEQVCSSLQSWHAGAGEPKEKSPTYLWMCFFCNNQYRIKKGQTKPEELKEAFESNLTSIGKMLIILDSCVTPQYTERMWCVFETFVSVQQKIQPEVILPESATQSLAEDMQKESNTMEVMQRMKDHLNAIKVENATAREPADAVAIKKIIEDSIGYEVVNTTVRKRLLPHMSKAITKYFEAFMEADGL